MHRWINRARRSLRQTTLWLGLALASGAQAGPVVLAPYAGAGNAVLFDALTGQGGWTGQVTQVADIGVPDPLSLVSVVLFQYDAITRTLMGQFEFTDASDLASTLVGLVMGSASDTDLFGRGGPLALDYTIQGGTGRFAQAQGYGLAFLQYDPQAMPDNYTETGLLVFSVPEPGSATLVLPALVALALVRRPGRRCRRG